ncbi:MAG: M15 family metallopeptidase [Candidatus Marsarchaeota archaeon]|nr:M15 family metallopeptidase [Candidatus Marsarchaeota archaeon]
MSASRAGLDPKFIQKLTLFEKTLAEHGIKVVLTWGYRSIADQNKLYAKGRTAPGNVVTNAYGGYSWHNFGLAADYAFVINGKVTWNGPWDVFGKIARQCGLEWGGSWKKFKDRPHVQWTGGRTLAQMRATMKARK